MAGPLFVLALVIIAISGGCTGHHIDPRLTEADAKMEDHPDSSMMILDKYEISPETSDLGRAMYGLLLTHARYKNFIDETDDSLISCSADYFLDHGDKELASRALFLQGIIRMNANHLGEAAVSFSKGLDIAHENKSYMWEGQCARGLFIIYGKLKNASEQIKYAQVEYDAFINGGYLDWSNFAKLNILRAYQNTGKHQDALEGSLSLLKTAEETKDSLLMEEVLTLMGTCQYSIGDHYGSLKSYYKAYTMDPTVINADHCHNITIDVTKISIDSITDQLRRFIDDISARKDFIPALITFANQGQYEEAYNGLVFYKNMQDSILRVIMQNNVTDLVDQYESTKEIIRHNELRNERIYWTAALSIFLIIIVASALFYKKNLYQRKLEKEHLEVSVEMLRTDLASQLKITDSIESTNRTIRKRNEQMSSSLRDMLYDRYRNINDLCDSYFQERLIKSKQKKLEKEMESILTCFSDKDFLNQIGAHIDLCLENLYTSFITDFPDINDETRRLFMFLTLELSTRSICVILGIETSNFYNRKSRLKKMIAESDAERKVEYLKNMH